MATPCCSSTFAVTARAAEPDTRSGSKSRVTSSPRSTLRQVAPTSSERANPRTELWVVPGCEHVMAYSTHPDEWAQHVLGFLGRELGGEKPVVVPAGILAASPRGG